MALIIITGIVVVAVIAFAIVLLSEQRDKERRRREGLPQKKYHDITDYDVTSLGLESYDLSALYYLLGYDNTTLDRLLELADRQATGASIR